MYTPHPLPLSIALYKWKVEPKGHLAYTSVAFFVQAFDTWQDHYRSELMSCMEVIACTPFASWRGYLNNTVGLSCCIVAIARYMDMEAWDGNQYELFPNFLSLYWIWSS